MMKVRRFWFGAAVLTMVVFASMALASRILPPEGIASTAVEEIVRWTSPVNYMKRHLLQDVELHGTKMRAGEDLVMFYASANRDESVFDDPDRFWIERPNARRHVAFGYGIHRCVGARLAELQLRVLLEELHKRRMRVHVAGDIERVRANFVHGFRKLEVEITQF